MPRRHCKFTARDIARAIRGVQAAGYELGRVEIGTDGQIVVFPRTTADSDNPDELTYNPKNPAAALDEWLARQNRGKR